MKSKQDHVRPTCYFHKNYPIRNVIVFIDLLPYKTSRLHTEWLESFSPHNNTVRRARIPDYMELKRTDNGTGHPQRQGVQTEFRCSQHGIRCWTESTIVILQKES